MKHQPHVRSRDAFRCKLVAGSAATIAMLLSVSALAQGGVAASPAPVAETDAEAAATQPRSPAPTYNAKEHNLKKGLAIKGYDPVSYFNEGGAKPVKGLETITATHAGATYRFANQANAGLFKANPDKYVPTYGGWCAWAVAKGKKVSIDPKAYIVDEGQLYLFYSDDQVDEWKKARDASRTKADLEWMEIAQESRTVQSAYAMLVQIGTGPGTKRGPLAAELDGMREGFNASAPADVKEAFEQGVRDVDAMGLTRTSVQVGQKAPDFELPNAAGGTTRLADALAKGPVVVTFYRGGWCPYCNVQLDAMSQRTEEMKALGASVLAISPENPEKACLTKERGNLAFDVLSDHGNEVAGKFGISYELPEVVKGKLKGRVDFDAYNGADVGAELPLAATYLIATDGTVAWSYVDSDYRRRAEPEDVVAALTALVAKAKKAE